MKAEPKPLLWVRSALKDLKAFPQAVRREVGQALYAAQMGETYPSAKPLKGFGGGSVLEIVAEHITDAYRAVCTVRFAGSIYVLHAFQKKSKRGVATPSKEIELVKKRLKLAERDHNRRTGNGRSE